MNVKVVFIDDNLSEKDPFVRNISKTYEEEVECSGVFKNPDEGLKHVLDNLNKRMIVFIDWNFGSNQKKGIDLLKEIRKQTSLLYVVMMSANRLSDISSEYIIDMINEDNIFYLDRNSSSFEIVEDIINRIRQAWSTKFDCVLEEWLIRHPEDLNKEAFRENTRVYTWAEILLELRHQSEIGKSFEKLLNEYYIHLFNHQKK